MFIIELILFIVICGMFCYLYWTILSINKDIENLYDNYANELEKTNKLILDIRKELK